MSPPQSQSRKPLIVRYQLFCDDQSGLVADEKRVAEFVCSLASLSLYVEPTLPLHIFVYTLESFQQRLTEFVASFGFSSYTVVDIANLEDKHYADTIRHCTPVDRFCIRRMLSDFSILPSDQFRLLLGTDVFFYRPPTELESFYASDDDAQILYMVDNFSFNGELYGLTHHSGKMLKGLLGDFYCLAPGVSLSREQIVSCLNTIDAWPPENRWDPHPPGLAANFVHACEQQAAAILLGNFPAAQLPVAAYRHVAQPEKSGARLVAATVAHAHLPWTLIRRKAMPNLLAEETLRRWKHFGLTNAIRESGVTGAAIEKLSTKARSLARRFRASPGSTS